MKKILNIALFLAAVAAFLVLPRPAAADVFITLCSPVGAAVAGQTVYAQASGKYVADANGCIAYDQTKDPNGDDLHALNKAGWEKQNLLSCAGQVNLVSGTPSTATVTNACFTGATNVVVCTDATAVNAVKCLAANGSLAITGAASVTDTISYARIK